MNATDAPLLTAGALLFGETDHAEEIGNALREEGALKGVADALDHVPPGLRQIALERIGHVAADALGSDVLGVMELGWRKYERLTAAAERTLAMPGAEEIVDLATHRITSAHEPRVEVSIDDVSVATVELKLELSAELHAVRAVVRGGALVALRSGTADLGADLSCEGVPLKSARRTIDLDLSLGLGTGIVLVSPERSSEDPR